MDFPVRYDFGNAPEGPIDWRFFLTKGSPHRITQFNFLSASKLDRRVWLIQTLKWNDLYETLDRYHIRECYIYIRSYRLCLCFEVRRWFQNLLLFSVVEECTVSSERLRWESSVLISHTNSCHRSGSTLKF